MVSGQLISHLFLQDNIQKKIHQDRKEKIPLGDLLVFSLLHLYLSYIWLIYSYVQYKVTKQSQPTNNKNFEY